MKTILLETQLNSNGTLGTLITDYDDINNAQSSFHTVMAAANLSTLPRHGAVLMSSSGRLIRKECCYHHTETDIEEKYIVLEIQVGAGESVSSLINSFDNKNQAESTYHSILASAALSELPKHSAVILTDSGEILANYCYEH